MLRIRMTEIEDAEQVSGCVTSVARERRFLATTEGFSSAETRSYIQALKERGGVHLVALDRDEIVGWCDIARERLEASRHVGRLGIGLLPEYRGRGWGRSLLTSALDKALERGLERVELEVFSSNSTAIAVYRRLGLQEEGCKRKASKIDGRYDDVLVFGLLLESWAASPLCRHR